MKNIMSKNNTCSSQGLAGDAIGVSKDTSTLLKTVTGANPSQS